MIVWSHLTAGLAWNASTSTRKAQKRGFPWFSWFRVGAQGGLGFGKSLICWSSSRNIGMRMLKMIRFSVWICCCKYAWSAWWMRNRWNVGGICWFIGGPWWDDDDKDDQKKTTVAFTYCSILQGPIVSTIEFSAAKWYPVGYAGPWLWVCPAVIFRVGR